MTEETQETNHISTVRQHLLDQMKALRGAATPEDVERELGRSKGVSELAQAVVNTAKVEVDYLRATGQSNAPFLDSPAMPQLTGHAASHKELAVGNGINSVTQYPLKG